jgi:hypothetical protein
LFPVELWLDMDRLEKEMEDRKGRTRFSDKRRGFCYRFRSYTFQGNE